MTRTPAGWTTVRVRGLTDRAAVIRRLFEIGAEGVQELEYEVVTHLLGADEPRIRSTLREVDAAATVELSATPDVDWSAEWKARIGAHAVGPLVVTPPWLADRYPDARRVVIDPGMAFGTGEHETTRGVLRLLARHIRKGDMVADLGAGSAVLSIAAAKLGARRVAAIELDPEALGNAQENVERNDVASSVVIIEGDAALLLPLVAPVRVVLANIISSVLIALLPAIGAALAPDGIAILSGILSEEKPSIEGALAEGGWRILDSEEEGLWWSVAIAR